MRTLSPSGSCWLPPELSLQRPLAAWPHLPPRVRQQRLRAVVGHRPADIPALDSLYHCLERENTATAFARLARATRRYLYAGGALRLPGAAAGERPGVSRGVQARDRTSGAQSHRLVSPGNRRGGWRNGVPG